MKVTLYIMRSGQESRASWSIAPEIDFAYWLDTAFRNEADQETKGILLASGYGNMNTIANELNGRLLEAKVIELIVWPYMLPLGLAQRISKHWPDSVRKGAGKKEIISHLTRQIRESKLMDMKMDQAHPMAQPVEIRTPDSPTSTDAVAARELARQACGAAMRVQGRLLLTGEVLALIAADAREISEGVPVQASWDAVAPTLQLAALQGLMGLESAVSQQVPDSQPLWRSMRRNGAGVQLQCQRCGSTAARMRRTPCAVCGQSCTYCEACLTMGRSRECSLLVSGTPVRATRKDGVGSADEFAAPRTLSKTRSTDDRLARWSLSPAQSAATAAALSYMEGGEASGRTTWIQRIAGLIGGTAPASQQRRFLLWAVTGAGKTEMIFPLIEACLQQGGRALIATPRRDVVLELDPRLRKAFPGTTVVTLYGGSTQRWEYGELTIATTHQLFRFRHAFDLVVIDELDAFPYHNDPMLQYAAGHVCKPGGTTVLLSATPPAQLRRAAQLGGLAHVRVPVRFHRHPLPVPKLIRIPPVSKLLRQRTLPHLLVSALKISIGRGAQVFMFVQQIRDVQPLVGKLQTLFPDIAIEGTSSKDGGRADKVLHFRDRSIRLLVTTTILERGVTVPKSDVYILDADGKLFDDASLVQMAGRAGRSKDDPAGHVYFCASARTKSQKSAIAQIRGMNRIARKNGYLVTPGKE